MTTFKKRFGISIHTAHGEAGFLDKKMLEKERIKLYEISRRYERNNIFSFNESALFYKMSPNNHLASTSAVGVKYS